MTTFPLISVVLPVRYVHEDWLRQSIESVLNQDYPNKELIVVNDEATQDIDGVIQEYRIRKYIKNDRNRKLPYSLNRGFEQAEGELHTWTSADNYMLPGLLGALQQRLDEIPEAAIVYGRLQVLNVATRTFADDASETRLLKETGYRSVDRLIPPLRVYRATLGAAFLYRASVWNALKGYDEQLHGAEDYDFWVRAVRNFGIAILQESIPPRYVYRIHDASISALVPGCFDTQREHILRREICQQPEDPMLRTALHMLKRTMRINRLKSFLRSTLRQLMFLHPSIR